MSDGIRVNEVAARIHSWAVEKGWVDDFYAFERVGEDGFRMQVALIAEKLALVHSEVSEALEELRSCKSMEDVRRIWYHDGKPEGFAVELADAHIRLWNIESMIGLAPEDALQLKLNYNDTRAWKHGGKTI